MHYLLIAQAIPKTYQMVMVGFNGAVLIGGLALIKYIKEH